MSITVATVGLCLEGAGSAITAASTYLSHKDSKKTRETVKSQVQDLIKGLDCFYNKLCNLGETLNRIEWIARNTIDTINRNSKQEDYKHIYCAFEYLEQASLCTNENTALRYIDCAHQHFTEAFIGFGLRTDLSDDEKNNVCQAKIGDAICCYYLKDPVNACKRLYESNLERPLFRFNTDRSRYELDASKMSSCKRKEIIITSVVCHQIFRAAEDIAEQFGVADCDSLALIRAQSKFSQFALTIAAFAAPTALK